MKCKEYKIAVVLVNWNGGEFTIPCIASLLEGSSCPDWIIVVDNGSEDGSVDMVGEKWPDVVIIRNESNLGFATANNQGVGRALALGATYVWLLNNDTVVAQNCLASLIHGVEVMPNAACYTTKIFYAQPSNMLWYDGGSWHPLHYSAMHINQKKDDMETGSTDVLATDYISGCSMFMPVDTVKKYGLFCGNYIAYSEDADFCLRLRKQQCTLCYVKGAMIWHKVSASLKKNNNQAMSCDVPPMGMYLMVRNNFWTIRRNYTLLLRFFLMLVHIAISMKMILFYVVKRNYLIINSVINGVRQGIGFDLDKLESNAVDIGRFNS
ncbi:MAG: glycosyltransferase family 2 protein [Clostridia bacterium]|nr:glycosyltransferase family 2 protein [Clostridia bacterium]